MSGEKDTSDGRVSGQHAEVASPRDCLAFIDFVRCHRRRPRAKSSSAVEAFKSDAMNRKQRLLTIIALVAFVVIGAGHYLDMGLYKQVTVRVWGREDYSFLRWEPRARLAPTPKQSLVPDVRIPWFMLGVIYVGLFFLLADRKEKR
jgi:hypothetical protein